MADTTATGVGKAIINFFMGRDYKRDVDERVKAVVQAHGGGERTSTVALLAVALIAPLLRGAVLSGAAGLTVGIPAVAVVDFCFQYHLANEEKQAELMDYEQVRYDKWRTECPSLDKNADYSTLGPDEQWCAKRYWSQVHLPVYIRASNRNLLPYLLGHDQYALWIGDALGRPALRGGLDALVSDGEPMGDEFVSSMLALQPNDS